MKALAYNVCLTLALVALAGCSKPGGQGSDDGDGGAPPPATASSAASPAAAVATAGSAVSPMSQKPGLWQLTQSIAGHPGMVTKMCVDASMGGNMASLGMNASLHNVDCSQKSVSQTATGVDVAMTCTTSGRTLDSHVHVERVGDSEFHQTMDATFTPAVAGHSQISSTTDGKWLGACPADMKPGDVVTATGVKVNMYAAMSQMKAMTPN